MSESVDKGRYLRVCEICDIPIDRGLAINIDGVRIALFRDHSGRVYAYGDSCPHRQHPIHKGNVDAGVITCASHAWRFWLASGRSLVNPSLGLERFPVRIDNGSVEVAMSTS